MTDDNDEADLQQTQDDLNELRNKFLAAAHGHNKGTIISACMLTISIMLDDAPPDMKVIVLDNVEASLHYLRDLFGIPDSERTKQ
jgi:hypothetical protein